MNSEIKFMKSEFFKESGNETFSHIKELIESLTPAAEVIHIGGGSIPGALTKGDVDIQIRIDRTQFEEVVKSFGQVFQINNTELWSEDLAIFKSIYLQMKVDILVTVVGSRSDNCHKFKKLLLTREDILEEYNQMKASFQNQEMQDYKVAKAKFYQRLESLL